MNRCFLLLGLLLTAVHPAFAFFDTLPVNNPVILTAETPYNWYNNGSAFMQAVDCGAGFTVGFTGTTFIMNVDVSALVTAGYASTLYPAISYTVDSVTTIHQLASTDSALTLATGLANTNHTLTVTYSGNDAMGITDIWGGTESLKIVSFMVDTGKTIFSVPLPNFAYSLALGDSILIGALTVSNTGVYPLDDNATKSWAVLLAASTNTRVGIVGFCDQGWTTGISNVPGLTTSWKFIMSGIPRVFSPAPTVIWEAMGTNGTVTASTVTTWIVDARSTVGPSTLIHVVIPWGGQNEIPITAGEANYVSANPSDTLVDLKDYGSTATNIVANNTLAGPPHPSAQGQFLLYQLVQPTLTFPITGGSQPAAACSSAP